VQGHAPSEPKSLVEVRDQIAATLKQQQAAQQAQQTAAWVQAALAARVSPAEVAAKYQLKFTAAKFVGRSDTSVPAPVLAAAFSAPPPDSNIPETGEVALANGDQTVYLLTAVKAGDVSGLGKGQRLAQLQQLTRANAQAEFAAYLATLRQHAKIKINTSNIQE
jgi:peptidyl-prolyl cis-trans isomerase D